MDSARATLLGGALGDAIGLATEFKKKPAAQADLAAWGVREHGLRGWTRDHHRVTFAEGDWTDDTDQAVLICRSYSRIPAGLRGEARLAALAKGFGRELQEWERCGIPEMGDYAPSGLGFTVGRVVCHPLFGRDPQLASLAVWLMSAIDGGKSAQANGAVMRTAPVGVAHAAAIAAAATPADSDAATAAAADDAAALARTTHVDPACVASAVAASVAIAHLLAARYKAGEGLPPAPAEAGAAAAGGAAAVSVAGSVAAGGDAAVVLPPATIRAAAAAGVEAAASSVSTSAAWIRGALPRLHVALGTAGRDDSLHELHRAQAKHELKELFDDPARLHATLDGLLGDDAQAGVTALLRNRLGLVTTTDAPVPAAPDAAPTAESAADAGAGAGAGAGGDGPSAAAVGGIPASEVALLTRWGPLDTTSQGWTITCVQTAFWALRQAACAAPADGRAASELYKDALLAIAGEGGDADTNGAVAGALLGAALGPAGLPPDWLAQLGPRGPSASALHVASAEAAEQRKWMGVPASWKPAAEGLDGRGWLERELAALLSAVGVPR